jgi:putative CocE/NonD family hydrolase
MQPRPGSHRPPAAALMRRAWLAAASLLALLASPAPRAAGGQRQPPPPREVAVSKDVMVAMRDGVRLATDVYRPAANGMPLAGRFPVVLERTPYGKGEGGWAPAFARRGYVAIVQDVRGRYHSEGTWHGFAAEVPDGYDTAAWIAAQPWFDGHLGMVGGSYTGGTQHAMALSGAPALTAIVPTYALSNPGKWGIRHDGAFELRFLNWVMELVGPEGSPESTDPATRAVLQQLTGQVHDYAKGLPIRRGTTPLKLIPEYEDWLITVMTHADYDGYWRDSGVSVVDHLQDHKDVPACHVTGWYDSWSGPVANLSYPALRKTKHSPQRLIIGPWTHGGQDDSFAGEAEFGPAAAVSWLDVNLRWLDRWLKGVRNGVETEPPVRIFVMGGGDGHKTPEGRIFVGGSWRDENEWPLSRAVDTAYYLQADGGLSLDKPRPAGPSRFLADPRRPVPTLGGNISSGGALAANGVMDQRCRPTLWNCEDSRPLSARRDVLVFQTAPLYEDVEVTGRLIVHLYASSDAVDTDFTAKLVDVYPPSPDFPAGFDLNVNDGITRARYRDSLSAPKPLTPGTVYPITVEMYPTSLVFKRGHRIRLDVAGSNFPRFDVNPNTGEPLGSNRLEAVAANSVFHDPEHPSQLVLPVVRQQQAAPRP